MQLIEGVVRTYDWGSPTAIPELLGCTPTGEPWAELWFGAHQSAPSVVDATAEPLDRLIAADPTAALGAPTAARFGRLPFLVKVLAAVSPLSLQAHPSARHAEVGYEREEALGIPTGAPQRMFPDRSHKPEMVCALGRFEALCGFRDPARTAALLDTIDTAALDPVRQRLRHGAASERRDLLSWLLTMDGAAAHHLVGQVAEACRVDSRADEWAGVRSAIVELGARFPGDGGVIVALLLNHVVLEPGEAIFLEAGSLHAHLGGMAVEVMAESDNVVRGGLTTKHVNVPVLLDVVDFTAGEVEVQRPEPMDGVTVYRTPAAEFSVRRVDVDGSATVGAGPAVLLCIDGCAEANGVTLDRGAAAWVGAAEPPVVLSGRANVFRVGAGDGG